MLAVGVAALWTAPATTSGAPVLGEDIPLRWNGDFDTGDFRQWHRTRFVPGGARIVRKVRREGRYAARFVVGPGDIPFGTHERSEVAASREQTAGYGGIEAYYGWSTFFPRRFNPIRNSFNIFAQWHGTGAPPCALSPNVAFHARLRTGWRRPRYEVRVLGGELDRSCGGYRKHVFRLGRIRLRKWNDFVLHVKWSPARATGFIEAWINGLRVIPRTYMATLYRHQGVYVKQGLYRGLGLLRTTRVYQDAMKRGPTFESVTPRRSRRPVPR